MNNFKRVFLDTAPIIYFIQRNEIYFEQVKRIFICLRNKEAKFISSDITTTEACVYPYRLGKFEWLNDFDNFVKDAPVEIIHTSEQIAKKAAQIRAKYQGFKTMDSLQLATAVLGDCDLFLTNDKQLRQFTEIKCLTIDDFFSEGVES